MGGKDYDILGSILGSSRASQGVLEKTIRGLDFPV